MYETVVIPTLKSSRNCKKDNIRKVPGSGPQLGATITIIRGSNYGDLISGIICLKL